MSRKITRRFSAVLSALGVIWHVTSAEPAQAVFQAFNVVLTGGADRTLTDALGRNFFGPVFDDVNQCYYYVDSFNYVWRLESPIYYFSSNATNTSAPLVFGTLRDELTGTIWDGGFGTGDLTSASSTLFYLLPSTVPMLCPAL